MGYETFLTTVSSQTTYLVALTRICIIFWTHLCCLLFLGLICFWLLEKYYGMMLGPDMPAGPRLRIAGRGGEKTVKLIVLMSFFNSIIICLRHNLNLEGVGVQREARQFCFIIYGQTTRHMNTVVKNQFQKTVTQATIPQQPCQVKTHIFGSHLELCEDSSIKYTYFTLAS